MDKKITKKISFFEIKGWEKRYIENELSGQKLQFCKEVLADTNVNEHEECEIISVFINSKLDKALLSKLKKLKFIVTRSTGYDHIDLNYCKKHGITVTNVPSYGENTVAEHSMALLLAITRKIIPARERFLDGIFDPEGMQGIDVKDKIMGVIGTGHIGKCFMKMALGFNMRVIAFDKYPDNQFATLNNVEYVDLDYLIAKSDFISLHLPLLKSTKHLLNRSRISKMKKGVIIINTARGPLIETDALFDALREEKVGGAGIDVLEEEGFLKEELELLHKDNPHDYDYRIAIQNHAIAHLPNVIITPHSAFNSKEAIKRILMTTINNINCYVKGKCENVIAIK